MATSTGTQFVDTLASRRRHRAHRPHPAPQGGLRFAFYGRISTIEYQDAQTSKAWQRAAAEELVEGFGSVVAEFFDHGWSRRWPWSDRPAASALLAAAQSPDRAFDAVVVGEYERAFQGDQFRGVVERLNAAGVQVWLPEAGGPVELGSPVHQALMVLLGAQARREVTRARVRTLAAMRAQARMQGRFLGGRPPYGYRLADGGPHPNAAHARWGRRLQILVPDPVTARWVRWMFARRAAGRSIASLARELNERGVPCPSRADRARNPHRSGARREVNTVTTILANPRYTGRQVWNRQSTTRRGDGGRVRGRGVGAAVWNPITEWEVSEHQAHVALVDDDTFLVVQQIRAGRRASDGSSRRYALVGLMVCGVCGRRMDAHWVHRRPGYRCRHGYSSGVPRPSAGPSNVYVREDQVLDALPGLLGQLPALPQASEESASVVKVLREQGLQVVCDHRSRQLRPATAPMAAYQRIASGQSILSLEWDSHPAEADHRLPIGTVG